MPISSRVRRIVHACSTGSGIPLAGDRDARATRARGAAPSARPPQKVADGLHHQCDLLGAQLWVDGQRQRLLAGALAVREIALAVTERGEALLQVKGARVVDLATDAALRQVSPQRIA